MAHTGYYFTPRSRRGESGNDDDGAEAVAPCADADKIIHGDVQYQ